MNKRDPAKSGGAAKTEAFKATAKTKRNAGVDEGVDAAAEKVESELKK